MIQELLGGSGATGGLIGSGEDIKVSPLSGGILQPSPSPSPSSSTNTTATPPQNSSENQNQLRCPRCDSSNTKFCYYNNYNLTQPRHFCKTCRRYWTKGGALRNVPIGGGCRKNSKGNVGLVPSLGKPNISTGKLMKTHVFSSPEIGKSNSGFLSGFDHHDLSSNPILWASPQTSHLLALLRSTPNPNPNPMLNPFSTKEEGFLIGSHNSEPGYAHGFLNARPGSLGLDPISSSFWRNDNQNQVDQQQQQNGNFILGEVQNTGIQDQLYQRLSLKSSTNYYSDHPPAVLVGNVHASSSNSSANLESAPVSGGEIGNFWNNPSLSWSDLSTTNGAYR